MIRSNVRYRIPRLPVTPDLPLIPGSFDLRRIPGEEVRELREVHQHPAVVAMQRVPREDDLLSDRWRLLDAGFVEESGVGRYAADVALMHGC